MDSFMKMDIFFAVTTFAVLVLLVLATLIAYYVVQVARNLRDITRAVKDEAEDTIQDFRALRADVRAGVKKVDEYRRVFMGVNILRGITNMVQVFAERDSGPADVPKRRRQKKRAPDTEGE
ncbi:MAG: hypothetical protein KBD21_01850 [Candidatus Pacebacteria bacterium]|nr:hypothetical protein [Candidatus Paceibacterota bacterium]